jgi:hypothetical protein
LSRLPVCLSTPCGSRRRKSPSSEERGVFVYAWLPQQLLHILGVLRKCGEL